MPIALFVDNHFEQSCLRHWRLPKSVTVLYNLGSNCRRRRRIPIHHRSQTHHHVPPHPRLRLHLRPHLHPHPRYTVIRVVIPRTPPVRVVKFETVPIEKLLRRLRWHIHGFFHARQPQSLRAIGLSGSPQRTWANRGTPVGLLVPRV
jgi:hypothetical protein